MLSPRSIADPVWHETKVQAARKIAAVLIAMDEAADSIRLVEPGTEATGSATAELWHRFWEQRAWLALIVARYQDWDLPLFPESDND